jgi:hypothetical protein
MRVRASCPPPATRCPLPGPECLCHRRLRAYAGFESLVKHTGGPWAPWLLCQGPSSCFFFFSSRGINVLADLPSSSKGVCTASVVAHRAHARGTEVDMAVEVRDGHCVDALQLWVQLGGGLGCALPSPCRSPSNLCPVVTWRAGAAASCVLGRESPFSPPRTPCCSFTANTASHGRALAAALHSQPSQGLPLPVTCLRMCACAATVAHMRTLPLPCAPLRVLLLVLPSDGDVARDTLRLPAGLSRQYSRLSGDFNPIHLSALTAKLFGFRGVVAHGMSVLGTAMPTLLGPGGG